MIPAASRIRAHRRTEVVALAADGHHQGVVTECALRRDLQALVVNMGRHQHLAPFTIEAHHLAHAVAEVMPMRLREVAHLMGAHVHAAGGDLVQLGFPYVGALSFDECDVGLPAPAERVA